MSGDENLAGVIDDAADLVLARSRAEAARARLTGTLVEIQARLNPKALAREAMGELKEAAQDLARGGVAELKRHPVTLASGAAAIAVLLARGPIRRLIEGSRDETPQPSKSLKPKRASARRKGPST